MPQPSPINLRLLVVATICVDAVSMCLIYGGAQQLAEALYVALVCGQLSALCAWASFSRRPLARSLVAFLFAIGAALWAGMAEVIHSQPMVQLTTAYAGLWLTQVVFLLALFWAMKHSAYGRSRGQLTDNVGWQFSLKHLLATMTAMAILIVVLRSAEILQEIWVWAILLIANNVAVALSAILIHGTRWHGISRFAATAGVAALFGSLLYFIRTWPEIIAVNLIHAFMLLAWLEIGGIMPKRDEEMPADLAGTNR